MADKNENKSSESEQISSTAVNNAPITEGSGRSEAYKSLMGNTADGASSVSETADIASRSVAGSSNELPKSFGSFVRNGISTIGNKAVSLFKGLMGMLSAGLTAIASSVGMSVQALRIVGSVTGTMTLILIAALVIGYMNSNKILLYDDYEVDCVAVREEAAAQDLDEMGLSQVEEARLIYSALCDPRIGFKPKFVAGMLANAKGESELKPFLYEGYYASGSTMSNARAKYAFKDWNEYTLCLFSYYDNCGVGYNKSAYYVTRKDGKKILHPGLGLWQWTGGRAGNLINFAEHMEPYVDNDHDGENDRLYETDVQLAWLIKEDYAGVVKKAQNWTGSPTEAAEWFLKNWEGWPNLDPNTTTYKRHVGSAENWYKLMTQDKWATSSAYAGSIVEMAAVNLEDARLKGIEAAYAGTLCDEEEESGIFDNSSIAAAAVSFAYPKGHPEYANLNYPNTVTGYDGKRKYIMRYCTSLYVVATNVILNGSHLHAYSACDVTVGMSVRATGLDDDYPCVGCTPIKNNYLSYDSDWKRLGEFQTSSCKPGDLRPGDVLICGVHTQVVVSRELCAKKWPNLDEFADTKANWDATDYINAGKTPPDSCCFYTVHGSFASPEYVASNGREASRGPRAQHWDSYGLNGCDYLAFRYVGHANPESSSIYKRLASVTADLNQQHDGSSDIGTSDKSYSYWYNLNPTKH